MVERKLLHPDLILSAKHPGLKLRIGTNYPPLSNGIAVQNRTATR
jgi:hypothetical protein